MRCPVAAGVAARLAYIVGMMSAECELPKQSRLGESLPGLTYCDSFWAQQARAELSIEEAYVAVLGHLPIWFKRLLALRTRLVSPLGLIGPTMEELNLPLDPPKAYSIGDTILRWTIYTLSADEIITGMDDKHLDFRVSVMRDGGPAPTRIVLSTAVQPHNAFGRAYLATIKPFHRFGVRTLLSNAAASGRI